MSSCHSSDHQCERTDARVITPSNRLHASAPMSGEPFTENERGPFGTTARGHVTVARRSRLRCAASQTAAAAHRSESLLIRASASWMFSTEFA